MALEDDLRELIAADPVGFTVARGRSRELLDQLEADLAAAASQAAAYEWMAGLVNDPGGKLADKRITLHAAMATVLEGAPQRRMRAQQLAREIDRRSLYRMKDGRSVEAQQIHARVGHYSNMFAREGAYIVLIQPEDDGVVEEGSGEVAEGWGA